MNQPERHHYVPAFYLAEFAETRVRHGRLRVFDVNTGRTYGGTPDSVAFERDLYRIKTKDPSDALIVETRLAELEGMSAPVIKAMNDSGKLPDDEGLTAVFALLTFQAVRVPAVFEKIERFQSDTMLLVLKQSAANPAVLRKYALQFDPTLTDEDIAELKQGLDAFLSSPNPSLHFEHTHLVATALDATGPIARELERRHWSLATAPESCPLITTDNPIVFQHAGQGAPSIGWAPAFGRSDTTVVWPTGARRALFGFPYRANREHQLNERTAAQLNTLIAVNADERVYFGGSGFRHLAPDGSIVDGPTAALHRK
jgi:hypothetical protein